MLQITLAIRDEVIDLERAGIAAIQIDEPAYREGLPLRRADWQRYMDWASRAFRVSASGVGDATQIHTHMCYSEFNDILAAIAAMDADVITIETSRSTWSAARPQRVQLSNEIGPGVYDIHSPRIPDTGEMTRLLEKAARVISPENLWVNPDCGLKTRGWAETEAALVNMVAAAQIMREHTAKRHASVSHPAVENTYSLLTVWGEAVACSAGYIYMTRSSSSVENQDPENQDSTFPPSCIEALYKWMEQVIEECTLTRTNENVRHHPGLYDFVLVALYFLFRHFEPDEKIENAEFSILYSIGRNIGDAAI